jgi:hypothetical protein
LVKGGLISQNGWGFCLKKKGEEKIFGKVFPKAEKFPKPAGKPTAPKAASTKSEPAKKEVKKAK